MKIIRLETTHSTNLIAKQLIDADKCEPTLIIALSQTAGKGQLEREFSSPPGGLYFSLLIKPELASSLLPLVTLVTGLACAQQLCNVIDNTIHLKWPNDVYVNGKKICGILCESVMTGQAKNAWVVIGVGINVNSSVQDYPPALRGLITTVKDLLLKETNLELLCQNLITHILYNIDLLKEKKDHLLEKWQHYDYLYSKELLYTSGGKTIKGIGCGIAPSGGYLIQCDQGKKHEIIGGQLRLYSNEPGHKAKYD